MVIYTMVRPGVVEVDRGMSLAHYNKHNLLESIENLRKIRHLFATDAEFDAEMEIMETALAYLETHS